MRALFLLTLIWLAFQLGGFLIGGRGAGSKPDLRRVEWILSGWPRDSREVVRGMVARWGLPDVAADDRFRWDRNGKIGIEVYRDGSKSDRARPHASGIRPPSLAEPR